MRVGLCGVQKRESRAIPASNEVNMLPARNERCSSVRRQILTGALATVLPALWLARVLPGRRLSDIAGTQSGVDKGVQQVNHQIDDDYHGDE